MVLIYRPLQPEDIPECVKIMASHPVFGPRYGRDIDLLPEAWLCLLQSEAKITAVFRSGEDARAPGARPQPPPLRWLDSRARG